MQLNRLTANLSILYLAVAFPLAATAMTPGQLLQECAREAPSASRFCDGYIAAAVDAGRATGQLACLPADISHSTLKELAMNTLRNASASASHASSLINDRLANVFPCPGDQEADNDESDKPLKKNWSNKERLAK
jgi:hypothetical protein